MFILFVFLIETLDLLVLTDNPSILAINPHFKFFYVTQSDIFFLHIIKALHLTVFIQF